MSQSAAQAVLDQLAQAGVRPASVSVDSRQTIPGDLFLGLPGHITDGRRFLGSAAERGACALLWDDSDGFHYTLPSGVVGFGVPRLRELTGWLAHEIYGRPSERLWMAGVTGTNGKTTVSQWLAIALNALDARAGVIGTLGTGWPEAKLNESANTTPAAPELHRCLAKFLAEGAHAVAMEVSSIGQSEGRVNGVQFDLAIFTNLTRDHLDYHGDMETYARAKSELFAMVKNGWAVINVDDPFGLQEARRLALIGRQVVAYSCAEEAPDVPEALMLHATNISGLAAGLKFDVHWLGQQGTVRVSMVAPFNISNLLAVLGALLARGTPFDAALGVLAKLQPPQGRMQLVGGVGEPLVVIDYAHSPDALENALRALQPTAKMRDGKLVCVFGCGGDRDRGKRPMMGKIATREADEVWITSDNPRFEPPERIIADIVEGAGKHARVEPDRAKAIQSAIVGANANDVVILAGKGHEPYQETSGVRLAFSDFEQAHKALTIRHAAASQEEDAK